jgi:dolichyl-phosphate beta-glucosyltransferase
MMMSVDISVIIPCYNEAQRIKTTIRRLEEFFVSNTSGTKDFEQVEVICIENGSSDNTTQVLEELIKHSPLNMKVLHAPKGKGSAVREGVKQAKYEYVLVMDADNATDIKFVSDMVLVLGHNSDIEVDIINSSRRIQGASVAHKQGMMRQVLGNLFHVFVRRVFNLPVTDSQNGFKLFKTTAARNLYRRISTTGWVSEIELFLLAKKQQYIVKEIPVVWNDISGSTLGVKDIPKISIDLMKLYWRYVVRGV